MGILNTISFRSMVAASLVGLAACSGGGGGGNSVGGGSSPVAPPPPPPPPTSSDPTWTAGVYEAASSFEQRCENPRSGVDIEGNAFVDVQGSTTIENFWLRSWTEETYLWNDEVTDRNPANFSNRLDYFALLRTTAVEPSGEDRDDFHFSQSTEEFLRSRNSAGTASYGFSLEAIRTSPPRDYRIRYVDPDTPAAEEIAGQQQFERGSRILAIDGADLVNGGALDILNAGLFPATAGETHTFDLRDADGTERTISITSADLSRKPVLQTEVINTPSGKVGYIVFNTFSPFASEEEIIEAVETLAAENIVDLVLDLRYNGGGLLAVASQLSYMIAGPAFTDGKIFETLQFNDDAGNRNPVTGEINDPVPFYETALGFSTTPGVALPRLDLSRVFILSTSGTCSASEAVVNGLTGIDFQVVLIGDITCGKPYGFYPTDNCGETYYTIQFAGVNDKGFGDYADGFVPNDSTFAFGARLPGCTVQDDLSFALGDTNEPLLSAALNYRLTDSCPVPTTSGGTPKAQSNLAIDKSQALRQETLSLMETNRDMTLPEGDRL